MRKFGVLRSSAVDLCGKGKRLTPPIVHRPLTNLLFLLLANTIHLCGPFLVAPFVSALQHIGIPDSMKVSVLAKELHGPTVTTQVGLVSHVHRLVKVAHQMYEHLQCQALALGRRSLVLEHLQLSMYGRYDITVWFQFCILIGHAGIDVLVVPGLGVGILRSVAGIVQPVAPVHHTLALEQASYCLACTAVQMSLGYLTCHVMSFLPPCKEVGGGGKQYHTQERESIYVFHNVERL